jgi:hypothetical protein
LIIWYEDLLLKFHSTVDRIGKVLNSTEISNEMIEGTYQGAKFLATKGEEDFITRNVRDKWKHKNEMGPYFRAGKNVLLLNKTNSLINYFSKEQMEKNLPLIIFDVDGNHINEYESSYTNI